MSETNYIEKEESPQLPTKRTPLEVIACTLSYAFPPFIVPLVIFLWLYFCTYLNIMPIQYKLFALSMIFCFSMLMPMFFIYLYQRINGKTLKELGERKRRFIPYLLSVMGYSTCLLVMHNMYFPRYMSNAIIACILCMTLCALINLKWKISTHTAANGLLLGSLLAYSLLFLFNPVWMLCILILHSGMIGTARIIVKQHTLCEVIAGFVVGMFCGVIGILFI